MTQTLTIQLSESAFDQLRRTAELARQPLDVIVEQSLLHSLPPLLEEIPPVYQSDVYPLLMMSEAELVQEAQQRYPPERWAEYELLLDKKKETALTQAEQAHLEALRRTADVLMFRKGYAAALLKRRGHALPALAELPRAA